MPKRRPNEHSTSAMRALLILIIVYHFQSVFALALCPTVTVTIVPSVTNFSHPTLVSTTEPSPARCNDIEHCRTLWSIISSCLTTIFACVWVAVHRNIPGPKQSWTSTHIEWLKVIVLALLLPEWILGWAVRQFLNARGVAQQLEAARLSAQRKWAQKPRVTTPDIESAGRSEDGPESDKNDSANEGVQDEVGGDDVSLWYSCRSHAMDTDIPGDVSTLEAPDTCKFNILSCLLVSCSRTTFHLGKLEARVGRTEQSESVAGRCLNLTRS